MKINIKTINTKIIIAFLYWIAFEWPLLSKINNYNSIALIRSIIDIIPISLMLLNLIFQIYKLKYYEIKILACICLIYIITSISVFIEGQNNFFAIKVITTSFRYFPFLYLIRKSKFNIRKILYRHIRIIFWVLFGLSIFELMNKALFVKIFLPNATVFASDINSVPVIYNTKKYEISCTFINTIDFSFFIILISLYYIFQLNTKRKAFLVYILSLIMIFFSLSVASIFLFLIIGWYIFEKYRAIFIAIFVILIIAFSTSNLIMIISDTSSIRTYYEISNEYSRVGYFTKLLPEFFKSNIKDIILGMGISDSIVNNKLLKYDNIPKILYYSESKIKLLKDVYWIGIILTEGIIAFFLYISILSIILRVSNKINEKVDYKIIKYLIIITIFLGLFNQPLDVKSYSFALWVMIGIILRQTNIRN